jgi:hypothetical protein
LPTPIPTAILASARQHTNKQPKGLQRQHRPNHGLVKQRDAEDE